MIASVGDERSSVARNMIVMITSVDDERSSVARNLISHGGLERVAVELEVLCKGKKLMILDDELVRDATYDGLLIRREVETDLHRTDIRVAHEVGLSDLSRIDSHLSRK